MDRPEPADAEERARVRQWRLAQLNLGVATFWLALAGFWWFVDEATWQPPVFTVLGVALVVAAISNVRQQRRNQGRQRE